MFASIIRLIVRLVDLASGAGLRLAAVIALVGTLMIVAEVIIRYGQLANITFADEFSGYFFAFICFLSASDALRSDSFIRVRFVSDKFPKKVQKILMLSSYVFGLVAITLIVVEFWGYFMQSVKFGTTSVSILRIPLCIPQVFVVIGSALLWFQLLILFLRDLFSLFANRQA
jgi:TRAP-type C4-dicarboxylate transport system permease small subunit